MVMRYKRVLFKIPSCTINILDLCKVNWVNLTHCQSIDREQVSLTKNPNGNK